MPLYRGQIKSVIYRNEESGYAVLEFRPEQGQTFTIVGILPFAGDGDYIEAEGDWTAHATYGEQFKVSAFHFYQPESRDTIEKYLGSGAISGIGAEMARRITRHFGGETLKVLDTQPERLIEVSGIGRKKALQILTSYLEKRDSQNALMYFMGLGVSPSIAKKIYDKYRQDAVLITRSEPYRLADEISGIGFRTADRIALSEGYALNDERRLRSGIGYVLSEALNGEGHTFLPESLLLKQCADLLEVPEEEISVIMTRMIMKNELVCEAFGEGNAVYLRRAYECEADVAVRVSRMLVSVRESDGKEADIPETLSDGTKLSEKQVSALKTALGSRISIITGGPGTGKTTLIRGILDLMGRKHSVRLCAPTGRAAKRMSEATDTEAMTIHRLLEYGQGEEAGFARNEDRKLKCDILIVDETSMVDIFLIRALLRALPGQARLVLVGDADQLPSVGAGNVLRDLIDSDCVPVVRLTEVFRQGKESAIVMNAHRINRGEMPVVNEKQSDFFMERTADAAQASRSVAELVTRRLPGYMNLDPVRDIQVMTPMKKGDVGVTALNRMLQEKLNPLNGRAQLVRGETSFRAGDKVMQTKNDYTLGWYKDGEAGEGVFNGDIGYITKIDVEDNSMIVRFDDDRTAKYEKDMIEELELAYCMTVHKSQGSEFTCVVMPLISGPPMLMTRNLLYTAVTRARRLVVLTGRQECVWAMVHNDHIQDRYSSLAVRLKQLSGAV